MFLMPRIYYKYETVSYNNLPTPMMCLSVGNSTFKSTNSKSGTRHITAVTPRREMSHHIPSHGQN